MIKLRDELKSFLKAIHPRVYYEQAPKDAVFPYIVFDIPNSFSDGEGFEQFNIDIDGWDDKIDTTVLEKLMANINQLDKHSLINEEFAAAFYLQSRLTLTDDDKRIRRRKYTYNAKIFERS